MFPGCQKTFNRPADLERHYKNTHASEEVIDRYECDYPNCERYSQPFRRKDHFRDHLRDYHKEDIAIAPRRLTPTASDSEQKRLHEEREAWEAERIRWWRCARCLTRVEVFIDGYECRTCNLPLETDRQDRRRNLAQRAGLDIESNESFENLITLWAK